MLTFSVVHMGPNCFHKIEKCRTEAWNLILKQDANRQVEHSCTWTHMKRILHEPCKSKEDLTLLKLICVLPLGSYSFGWITAFAWFQEHIAWNIRTMKIAFQEPTRKKQRLYAKIRPRLHYAGMRRIQYETIPFWSCLYTMPAQYWYEYGTK